MKKQMYSVLVLLFALVSLAATAQDKKEDKSKRPSPPAVAEGTIDGIKVKVDYGAPSARGRKMLGGIEKYGTVWRTGANETTIFEIDKDAKIEGQALPKGKYALFSIPGETEWTIIINKTIKWGAYDYKEAEDVLRVKVPAGKTDKFVEKFNIAVTASQVVIEWENTKVAFKVSK